MQKGYAAAALHFAIYVRCYFIWLSFHFCQQPSQGGPKANAKANAKPGQKGWGGQR